MLCQSACVSSARLMSLECLSALCRWRNVVAPMHVLPEHPFETARAHLFPERVLPEHLLLLPECCVFSAGASSRTCTAGAPSTTAGALCL
ncbi:hypothetical protein AMTRI_Chr06g177080 [Amborella trichopoda]